MMNYKTHFKGLIAAVLLGGVALAGCASIGDYEQGATKSVATSVVVRQAKTGNYEIMASGLRLV